MYSAPDPPNRNDGSWQNSVNPLNELTSIEMQVVRRIGSTDLGGGDPIPTRTASPPAEQGHAAGQQGIGGGVGGVTLIPNAPHTVAANALAQQNSTAVESGPPPTSVSEETQPDDGRMGGTTRSSSTVMAFLSTRSSSAVVSFLSASAQSLHPTYTARRAHEWCRIEGASGTTTIAILCALVINLVVILTLHCIPLLDWLQGRPGVREMVLVTPAVSLAVGIMCGVLLARVLWALVSITCRHGATHAAVGRRLRLQKKSEWRVVRAWDLFELLTSPGGRFFDVFEFVREIVESFLQILAVGEYAINGVDRAYLDFYVAIIGLNSLSSIVLIAPKCAPKRWGRLSPRNRARRERAVLLLDVVCDTLCTFCMWPCHGMLWRGFMFVCV